jgi:hypothetical protein
LNVPEFDKGIIDPVMPFETSMGRDEIRTHDLPTVKMILLLVQMTPRWSKGRFETIFSHEWNVTT